jgi:predicted ATPase/class 3 adenylate cyclase
MALTDYPSGTVTFMFTDVEGSTQLWEHHPAAMRTALADHDAIVRSAVERHTGVVFKTIGDAFCTAFVRPEDALAAAVGAQRDLSAHAWTAPIDRMRVRIGIHTGTAIESGGDYYGPTVNRVARLMSLGYGEQILVSSATAQLLRDVLPAQTSLRELGSHRLKGLSQPETVYLVVAQGLRSDFPALRSPDSQLNGAGETHNLPLPLTTFYGRDAELATLSRELGDHRLVTLVGLGGVGKTRMAVETGWQLLERFPDGIYLAELAPLADPNLVSARIATALGLPAQTGQLSGDLWIDALRDKRALLILDNCEHVLDAVAESTHRLLQRCPDFRVLATSREPLRLPGERVLRIAPLGLPASGHDGVALGSIRDAPAVLLFLDRVSNTAPDFAIADDDAASWEAVGHVCSRLDGIPLALELAAARVSTLGLPRLARGLDDRFRLLTGGARTSLPRQQTLQATLDWSYAVLAQDEQRVFNRLGVFAGGFTAEAASAVCSSDEITEIDVLGIVASLADKSLVVADSGPAPRYRLLETTRAYALQRSANDSDLEAARRRHAEHCNELAIRVDDLYGKCPFEEWAAMCEPETDNVRAALAWTIEQRGDVLLGATILWNSRRHFEWLSLSAEVLRWCDRALSALGDSAPQLLEAQLNYLAARHHMGLGAFHAAIPNAQRAVALSREVGAHVQLAYALIFLARALASQPESREAADRAMDEALAIFAAAESGTVHGMNAGEEGLPRELMGILASGFKAYTIDPADIGRRRALLTEAIEQYRTLSPGHYVLSIFLENLSELELEAGNYDRALELARESVASYHRPGSTFAFGQIWALNAAGTAAVALGDAGAACAYAGELLSVARRIGSAPGLGMALLLLAAIEGTCGDGVLAAGLLGAWETCAGKIDTPAATTHFLSARTYEALAKTLDPETVAAAVADAKRWSVEEAIDVAAVVAAERH